MTLFRLLNAQGIAGLAVAAVLAVLLVVAKIDTHRFKNQSAQFQQLYRAETKAHAETVASHKLATERARAADRANAERVEAAQASISERIAYDFETRLAGARARAQRLRESAQAPIDRGSGRDAAVPGLPTAPARPDEATGQDRLPGASRQVATSWGPRDPDRLIATEQAIQLDALIKWVLAQASVEPSDRASE